MAHMEDNSEKVGSTTIIEQGQSLKPRSGKPRVKFQLPKETKSTVKQIQKNNTGNAIQGGKKK